MTLPGIPISEDQCMGDSLPYINNALTALNVCCDANASNIQLILDQLPNLISTTDLGSYIAQPTSPFNGQTLIFNTSTSTWESKHVYDALIGTMGSGLSANSQTKKFDLDGSVFTSFTSSISNKLVPTGAVMMFCSLTIPPGWLECNGAVLDKTNPAYANLFELIQYTFGGSGNNFNLPNLRDAFVRGADQGLGGDPGRVLGTSQSHTLATSTNGVTYRHVALVYCIKV